MGATDYERLSHFLRRFYAEDFEYSPLSGYNEAALLKRNPFLSCSNHRQTEKCFRIEVNVSLRKSSN